jgi:hypothetical protein
MIRSGTVAAQSLFLAGTLALTGPITAQGMPVQPDAEAVSMAACLKDMATLYPQMSQDNLSAACADQWQKTVGAGPFADAVLGVVPTTADESISLDAARKRLPQVRWDARPQGDVLASGSMGMVSTNLEGRVTALTRLNFAWQEVGGDPPYDVAGAMTARGAGVTPRCSGTGPNPKTIALRLTMPAADGFQMRGHSGAAGDRPQPPAPASVAS